MPSRLTRAVAPALATMLPLSAVGTTAAELPAADLHAHRRALLQVSQNRRAFGSVNHLIIFTGVLTGLAFSIIVIFCLCVHLRFWRGREIYDSADRRRRGNPQQQIVLRQAKTLQLPVLVIGPGNEVSYAHKLDPEADLAAASAAAAAAKQCSSGNGAWAAAGTPDAEAGAQPDSPAVVEMTVLNMDNPAAVPAPAVPMLPSAAQNVGRTGEHAVIQPGAASAEAGGAAAAPAAAAATAAAISAPSPGAATRVQQRMRQWYSRQGQADREAQEAARRQQLAWLRRPDDEPEPEVRIIPAFIEWDVTSGDGPIVHPPPVLPPQLTRPSRAAEVARAEAALLTRANSRSSRRGTAFLRSGSRGAEAAPPPSDASAPWDAHQSVGSGGGSGGENEGRSTDAAGSMGAGGSVAAGSSGSAARELRARSAGFGQMWRRSILRRPSLHAASVPSRDALQQGGSSSDIAGGSEHTSSGSGGGAGRQ